MKIDNIIMEAVFKSSKSLNSKYMVGTGLWKMHETEDGDYIVFTDDFINPDKAFTALLLEDCDIVEGEKLLMLTRVASGDMEYALVLFKEQCVGDSDE